MMHLGSCISSIIHQDRTVTELIIMPSCLTACDSYEPNESDDVDSINSDENSINNDIYKINDEESGSREWFSLLGVIIAKLTKLTRITFDQVDQDAREMERFFAEISASKSLTDLHLTNVNVEDCYEIIGGIINAPSLTTIVFNNCTIPHDIGFFLHDVLNHDSLTTIHFTSCRLSSTTLIRKILNLQVI